MNIVEQIREKALKLQELIAINHPTMPVLLRDIHATLKANPDCVTASDEETIYMVVQGLIKQTNVEIATAVKNGKTKSLKNITVLDL